MPAWPAKLPIAVLDYKIDWSKQITGSILSAKHEVVSGDVIIVDEDFSEAITTVVLKGGVSGSNCRIQCLVETGDGLWPAAVVDIEII